MAVSKNPEMTGGGSAQPNPTPPFLVSDHDNDIFHPNPSHQRLERRKMRRRDAKWRSTGTERRGRSFQNDSNVKWQHTDFPGNGIMDSCSSALTFATTVSLLST